MILTLPEIERERRRSNRFEIDDDLRAAHGLVLGTAAGVAVWVILALLISMGWELLIP